MRHLLPLFLLAASVGVPLLADGQQTDYAAQLLSDAAARNYLQVSAEEAAKGNEVFSRTRVYIRDLSGDGRDDVLFVGHRQKSTALALFTMNTDGERIYAGFSPVDATDLPRVTLADLTGDEVADVKVESRRDATQTELSIISVQNGALSRVFRMISREDEQDQTTNQRLSQLFSLGRTPATRGTLTVTTRRTELIGSGRETLAVETSTIISINSYRWKNNRYEFDQKTITQPSAEDQLATALTLIDNGQTKRALPWLSQAMTSGAEEVAQQASLVMAEVGNKQPELVAAYRATNQG